MAGPALSDAAGAESSPAATDAPTVRQISAGRVAAVVPIRWALMVGGLVVATAVASFAVGLIAGSGPLDVRVGTEGPPAAADAPGRSERAADRPTVQPVEARGSAEGATASDGLGARGGDERSSVGAGSAAEVTADDGDDGSTLPDGLGYLLVRSSASDAHVYVAGSLAGATGKKLLVRCGLLHVRLGAVPLGEWISLGKPVSVACQGVTAVAMEPGRATELGAGKVPLPSGRSDRFSPDDL